MRVDDMRHELKTYTKYRGSAGWCTRVNAMPDNQVIALYHRLLSTNQIKVHHDGVQLKMSVHF